MNSSGNDFSNHLIKLGISLMTLLILTTFLISAQPSQALVNKLLPEALATPLIPDDNQPPLHLSHELTLPLEFGPQSQMVSRFNPNTLNSPAASDLNSNFAGPDFDTNVTNTGGFVFIPPDPIAAAGPNHVVAVVNVSIEWHTKAGVEQNSQSLQNFFASLSPVNFTFDPKVIYDQYEDRFVIVTLERQRTVDGDPVNSSRILVAVSDDGDPNGTWYFHSINSLINISGTDTWADYPGFAVDEEAVYITNNMFPFAGGTAIGVRLWIIDKGTAGGFYAGSPASVTVLNPYGGCTVGVNCLEITTQPAHIFDTPTSPTASTGTFLVGYSALTDGTNEYIQVMRLDNPLTTPTFSTAQLVAMGNIEDTSVAMLPAPQSGSATGIETNGRRALHAVWRNNELWLTTTIVPDSGADSGQATAHWVNINTSNLASLSLDIIGNKAAPQKTVKSVYQNKVKEVLSMLSYDQIKDKPSVLLSFTGLTQTEFEELLIAFAFAWYKSEQKRKKKQKRQRRVGGGRKPKLKTMADRLLFILFYLKTYPLQEVQAFMFNMSQGQANEWIHRLAVVLRAALSDLNQLPEREGKRLAEILHENETLSFAQDGCERRRQRPKDDDKQKEYYSGKKGTHTMKNHLVAHPESRRVCYLSKTVPGKKHDKKLADESEMQFPPLSLLEQDTGFQGFGPDAVIVLQPKKKPKGKELSYAEKFINRCVSSGRIVAEHVIAGVKRCRIVKECLTKLEKRFRRFDYGVGLWAAQSESDNALSN